MLFFFNKKDATVSKKLEFHEVIYSMNPPAFNHSVQFGFFLINFVDSHSSELTHPSTQKHILP